MQIEFVVDAKRIAALASNALNNQVSTSEAEAFLLLYGNKISELLGSSLREFVYEKLK